MTLIRYGISMRRADSDEGCVTGPPERWRHASVAALPTDRASRFLTPSTAARLVTPQGTEYEITRPDFGSKSMRKLKHGLFSSSASL